MRIRIIFACLILGGCQPPAPKPMPKPVDSVKVLKADIQQIAHVRPSGSEANRKVAIYLAAELRKAGFRVMRQPFSQGTNIIGVRTGASARTIIVGSHYDNVNCRGADDNGSGCAVNLMVARILAQQKLRHTLVVIFFDAEEYGLLGSTYYANNMREACDLMLNFDMVGHLKATSPLDTVLPPLFKKYPWAKAITFQTGYSPTDHTPFQRKGIPAIWLFTGTHEHYHQSSDVPSTLNYEGMAQIGRYALDLLLAFDRRMDTAFIRSLPLIPYCP